MKDAVPALFRLPVVSGYRYSAGAPLIQTVTGTGAYAKSMTRAFSGSGYSGDDPLMLPLLQGTESLDISYLGKFNLPSTGWAFPKLNGVGIGIDNTLITSPELVSGGGCNVASFTIPSDLSSGTATATNVQPSTLFPTTLAHAGGSTDGGWLCGAMLYNGSVYAVQQNFYDASGQAMEPDRHWITRCSPTNFASQSPPNGMAPRSSVYPRRCVGPTWELPESWKPVFGKPCVVNGGTNFSSVASTSCGYGFNVFDPADVSEQTGQFTPVIDLMWYDYNNNLRTKFPLNADGGSDWWNDYGSGQLGACFIPTGTRTLVICVVHGVGPDGGQGGGSSGTNAPHKARMFYYDLRDIKDSLDEIVSPWNIVPYDWQPFPFTEEAWPTGAGWGEDALELRGAVFDPATKRIYWMDRTNLCCHVWQFAGA